MRTLQSQFCFPVAFVGNSRVSVGILLKSCLFFLLLGASQSQAIAAPVVLYSDLDSGPVGSFVTVWGRGFGTKVGSVKVGSVSTATSDVISWRSDRIEFRLPSGSGSGISVVDGSGSGSNTVEFVSRSSGHVYFVSRSDGSNSNDGLSDTNRGSGHGPWHDLVGFLAKVGPGDVVYVRTGAYPEIGDSGWGTSVLIRKGSGNAGSAGMPIALVAYPGEAVTIGSTSARRAIYTADSMSYWTIAKFTLSAYENAIGGSGTRIRVIGNSANAVQSPYGTYEFTASTGLYIYGNTCSNCGQPGNKLSHAFYYGGYGSGSNVELGWNTAIGEKGGRGIQIYGHTDSDSLSNLSIHDNYIESAPYDCILVGASDASKAAWINDAAVFNNVANKCGDAGIRIENPGVSARVNHNTINASGSAMNLAEARSVEAVNNIFSASGAITLGSISSLALKNNGYASTSVPSKDSSPVVGSASFNNANGGDFSLRVESAFAGKAIPLSPALPGIPTPSASSPLNLGALGWAPAAATPVSSQPQPPTNLTVR